MTDTLPEVTLTMEQEARACDMATAMSQNYWGNFSCARLIVHQQDENKRLRTALTGISTCSTCEACRGAATLALGAPSTTEATPSSPDTFEGTFGNVLSGTCSKCYRASHVLSQQHGVCPECFSMTGDGP